MTEVIITTGEKTYRLQMAGHAMFNPGNDIVCAALSTIEYMLSEWVAAHPESAVFEHCREEPGLVDIELRITGREFDTARQMAETGFKALAETYPDNVKLYIRTGGGKTKPVCVNLI